MHTLWLVCIQWDAFWVVQCPQYIPVSNFTPFNLFFWLLNTTLLDNASGTTSCQQVPCLSVPTAQSVHASCCSSVKSAPAESGVLDHDHTRLMHPSWQRLVPRPFLNSQWWWCYPKRLFVQCIISKDNLKTANSNHQQANSIVGLPNEDIMRYGSSFSYPPELPELEMILMYNFHINEKAMFTHPQTYWELLTNIQHFFTKPSPRYQVPWWSNAWEKEPWVKYSSMSLERAVERYQVKTELWLPRQRAPVYFVQYYYIFVAFFIKL